MVEGEAGLRGRVSASGVGEEVVIEEDVPCLCQHFLRLAVERHCQVVEVPLDASDHGKLEQNFPSAYFHRRVGVGPAEHQQKCTERALRSIGLTLFRGKLTE